jgi:cytochrome c-type biogenesis protein CcmH/NrfF
MTRRWGARRVVIGVVAWAVLGGLAQLGAQTQTQGQTQGRDSLAGSGPGGTLWDPTRAGRPLEPVTAADNAAAIQVIEKGMRCTCGCNQDVYTCRTTDFSCTTSPAMHRRVMDLASRGLVGQQIVDSFVRENGIAILMAPPKRGFNLAGYFTPSLVILGAAVLLFLALRRWSHDSTPVPAPVGPPPPPDASPEELERLRRELEQFPN